MSTLYLETSALLSWLLGESRAGEVRARVDAAERIVTSVLTALEARRALIRAQRTGLMREADARRLDGLLARATSGWMCMEVHDEVLARAARSFPAEPVKTLDGLHLATALAFATAFDDLSMLSFDRRIVENAEALGLDTSGAGAE